MKKISLLLLALICSVATWATDDVSLTLSSTQTRLNSNGTWNTGLVGGSNGVWGLPTAASVKEVLGNNDYVSATGFYWGLGSGSTASTTDITVSPTEGTPTDFSFYGRKNYTGEFVAQVYVMTEAAKAATVSFNLTGTINLASFSIWTISATSGVATMLASTTSDWTTGDKTYSFSGKNIASGDRLVFIWGSTSAGNQVIIKNFTASYTPGTASELETLKAEISANDTYKKCQTFYASGDAHYPGYPNYTVYSALATEMANESATVTSLTEKYTAFKSSENVVLPQAGKYYRLNNYARNSGANYAYMDGNNVKANNSSSTSVAGIFNFKSGAAEGNFSVMVPSGKYLQDISGQASGGYQVTANTDAKDYVVTNLANTVYFNLHTTNSNSYNYLHDNGYGNVVGWNAGSLTSSQASLWTLVPVTGMDIYTVSITTPEGCEAPTLTYTPTGDDTYTGPAVYDGGFIAVSTGTTIAKSELSCSIDGYATYYDINTTDKTITVTFAQYPTAGYYRLKNVKGDHYLSNVLSGTIKTTSDKTASSIYNVTTMDGGYALQSYESNEYLQNPWHIGTGESCKKAWKVAAGNTTGYFTLYYSEGGHYMTGDGGVTWWTDDATNENAQWEFEPVMIESRTTAVGKYGTICLPYNATSEGVILMQMGGRKDNGILFNYVGETGENANLEAGVPYLYRATAATQTFKTTSTEYVEAKTVNGYAGNYVRKELSAGQYFLYTVDNSWRFAKNADGESETYVYVGAYKCYIPDLSEVKEPSSSARNAVIFGVETDETTGIGAINLNNATFSDGKYINNGRVVIVNNGKKYNAAGQAIK